MAHLGRSIGVVIPAYDPGSWLPLTLEGLPHWIDHVVVVDDGSTDDTSACATAVLRHRGLDHSIIRKDRNEGVGAAIVTGYERCCALNLELAVVMASDNQMDPADLHALVTPFDDPAVGYVKGNRFASKYTRREMPIARRLGGQVMSTLTSLAARHRISDSQCGYTAIRCELVPTLNLATLQQRYGYPNDLLIRLAARKVGIVEVPVQARYRGEPSGLGFRDAVLVIPWVIVRAVFRELTTSSLYATRSSMPEPSGGPGDS